MGQRNCIYLIFSGTAPYINISVPLRICCREGLILIGESNGVMTNSVCEGDISGSVCESTLLPLRVLPCPVISPRNVSDESILKSLIILVSREDMLSSRVLFLINLDNIGRVGKGGDGGGVVVGSFGGGGGLWIGGADNRERPDVEVPLPV